MLPNVLALIVLATVREEYRRQGIMARLNSKIKEYSLAMYPPHPTDSDNRPTGLCGMLVFSVGRDRISATFT
jgi:hypothetical protein